jgi:hypothetical protein
MNKSGQNGYLVYFADHGEEVYDYPHRLFAGRDEAAPTPAMYSVPFLVWRSESWKRNNHIHISYDTTRRIYSLSDFLHTWVDLAGIRFSEFDPGKSIISPRYKPGPVLIGDPAKPETLADVRHKFFPAAVAPATTTTTMQGPGQLPAVLQPPAPAYAPGHRAVSGTAPVLDQWMLHR